MATPENGNGQRGPRDASYWAAPVKHFQVDRVPDGALNLNVNGRRTTGPLQGFGQLWSKTYRVRLESAQASPSDVIAVWKASFPEFWPKGNDFYGSLTSIGPGEVAVLNMAMPGGVLRLSTGVLVIYADEESFTFMTPVGHMYCAFITFSAYEEDGTTVAQVQPMIRASDPAFEVFSRLGLLHRMEDRFWRQTLLNLAGRFGVQGRVEQRAELLDPRVQWREAVNLWQNAAIRSAIYTPIHWLRRGLRHVRERGTEAA